jgi:FG-GAP-like repeat
MDKRLPLIVRPVILALLLAPAVAAQGWLDTARWYVQPTAGEFHYAADFDFDGDQDLVWFKGQPGSPTDWTGFQVFFNDGTGDFPVRGPFVPLPAGPGFQRPLDLSGLRRLGDVTGDGQIDVLVLEEPSGFSPDVALHVYPGLGGGAFGAPVDILMTGDLAAIALGQIDGDAALELGILQEVGHSESTRWWNWNGAGFNASAEAFIFGGIGSPHASYMVALDLQGDGVDDLVFGQSSGLNLRVLPTVNGAPTVGQILTVGQPPSGSVVPYACDLQGGGPEDLLVVEAHTGVAGYALTPVLNVGGTLVKGLRQEFTSDYVAFSGMFDTGDVDLDGDVDVMAYPWQLSSAIQGMAAFFENAGDDTWGTGPASVVQMRYTEGFAPVGLMDLDLDGFLDAVGLQSAWFGRGRFEDSLAQQLSFYSGDGPRVLADAEGDGDLDMYFTAGLVRLNDGTGNMPGSMHTPPAPAGKLPHPATAIADLDADGRIDFLVPWFVPNPMGPFFPDLFSEMRLYVDDGFGHFADAGTSSTQFILPFGKPLCLALDLDQDGDNDLLDTDTNLAWRANDGAGHFGPGVTLVAGSHEVNVAADLDSDGDLDLLAQGWPNSVLVMEAVAPLTFVPHAVHEDQSSIEADSLTLADPDLDGDLDIACATQWGDSLLLLESDGALGFSLASTLSTNVAISFTSEFTGSYLAFDDVDGDGIVDLLAGAEGDFGSAAPNKVALFRGTGDGFDYEEVRWYAGAGMGPAGDLDGDGDLDLPGQGMVRSRHFEGPADGIIRQYGAGTAATSGVAPVLGAAGPLRPGSSTAELRVRRGVGGKLSLLMYGLGEAAIPGQPFASSTLYVQPPSFSLILVLGGTPGAQGQGTLDLPLAPVLPVVVGVTIYHQLAVFGGAGNGKTTSNGLQLTYGM